MGCMTDFGYVILETNLPTFMTIQACTMHIVLRRMLMGGLAGILNWGLYSKTSKLLTVVNVPYRYYTVVSH